MTDYSGLIADADRTVSGALGSAPTDVDVPLVLRDSETLAGRIDHTLLKADATATAIAALCDEAHEYRFASVCVNTRWVPMAAARLAHSDVIVCTVVGFPLGAMTRRAKAEEARITVSEGAGEVDMVIDIGGLLSGDLVGVYEDMRAVVDAVGPVPVKVILETCLLDEEQKAIACLIALRTGAAYVKTSTGFGGGGATAADIALMRTIVGDRLGVKASGGIRTRRDAQAMLAAGADRLGASASVAIVSGADAGEGDY
ncbi:MAG: deoxyribose-phosphate aldolase [Mycolicibacterium sp.]|uniref:deoxyribose-phosphate aldolase n=1 Tax=Mycolicibacterium sp. TaxID=2320850 RepID=UPI003D1105F2